VIVDRGWMRRTAGTLTGPLTCVERAWSVRIVSSGVVEIQRCGTRLDGMEARAGALTTCDRGLPAGVGPGR
jgi:hypothetical protein